MDLQAFREKLGDRKKRLKELEQQITEEGKQFIFEAVQELFTKYPEMESFGWEQGQYYNDEYYYFAAQIDPDALMINGKQGWDWDDEDDGKKPEWMDKAADEINSVLKEFKKNDFKRIFGQGARVNVTKTEITVEEFDTGY